MKKSTKIIIFCEVSKKQFLVKKICKISDMPISCQYYCTCYLLNGLFQDIYISESGIFYATKERN